MSSANQSLSYDQHQQVESHVPVYLKVFLALLIFTVLEYGYAMLVQDRFLTLVLGLAALAVGKASLVAIYFMHLKFEGRWVYALLIPTAFLATALLLAIYVDMGVHEPGSPSNFGEGFFRLISG